MGMYCDLIEQNGVERGGEGDNQKDPGTCAKKYEIFVSSALRDDMKFHPDKMGIYNCYISSIS